MAHTNATPNYSLPQFIGTDKPAWLTDFNGAMSAIDTAVKANEVSAATATASSAQNATAIAAQATAISTLQTKVGALETAEPINEAQIATNTQNIATNTQNLVQVDNTLGHTSIAGIGDGKVTGAIADLDSRVDTLETVETVEVTADGVKSYKDLLHDLCGLLTSSKITSKSTLTIKVSDNYKVYFQINSYRPEWGLYEFSRTVCGASTASIFTIRVSLTEGFYKRCEIGTTPAVTITDDANSVPTAGNKIIITY